ncbi:MAG TPA: TIGR02757 family protein [Polyangiaceae bacterium]
MTRAATDLKAALDGVRARCDVRARREADPVGFVHRYEANADRELVGLVAACIAFGNVKTIRAKLEDLLARLGPSPSRAADDAKGLRRRLRGWKHRVFLGEDVARLLAGARAVQRTHGSLGELFAANLAAAPDLRGALALWCDAIRDAGGLVKHPTRRGPAHLLPDPRGPSGSKRLLLYLRWMVRPADGIDLGLWPVPPARLLVPVDVHIHRLARNLGLTRRPELSWRTTEEITAGLARFDPADPTRYDFSLCHLGMLQRCPSRRDPVRCEGCGVQPVCVHWASRR